MCGFVFALNYSNSGALDLSAFTNMVDDLSHRGPDGQGFALVDSATNQTQHISNLRDTLEQGQVNSSPFDMALGHRRLSIQDLSENGRQPMTDIAQSRIIVYNGEIYNFPELKAELVKEGVVFNSNCDTEVILKAYEFYGPQCVKRFNGMWAFIIVDLINGEIFISRDRFGIKPLYHVIVDGIIYFASEANVFKHIPNFDLTPNNSAICKYLRRGCHEWEKETPFKNIYRFGIASNSMIRLKDFKGQFFEEKFWTLAPNLEDERFCKDKADLYAQEYYRLLKDAVNLRLRSDVAVGSALSGGLDSSSIVYLVNESLKNQNAQNKQNTFSSVYTSKDENFCDESYFIDLVTQNLQVNSYKITPALQDIPCEHGKAIIAMENLFDGSAMSGWHTYKLTNEKGIKVTLDGQGADEHSAGYLHYFHQYFGSSPLLSIPSRFMNTSKIPGAMPFIMRGIFLNLASKVVGKTVIERLMLRAGRRFSFNLNQALANDTQTSLVNLLYNSDRQSMAHSVESRLPFMDYRLIEFMNTVPSCYKIHNGWTKYLARLAFDGKLPDEVCWRRDKMGWPVPENIWFSGELKNWFSQTLTNNKDNVKKYIKLPSKAEYLKKNNKMMMRILNLSRWFEMHVKTKD